MVGEKSGKIYEIKIKPVRELSAPAQAEVMAKLQKISDPFNFKGYAEVVYACSSPLAIIRVDPIEGTIIDYFNKLMGSCPK